MSILGRFRLASTNLVTLGVAVFAWMMPGTALAGSGPVERVGVGVAVGATSGFGISARLRMPQGIALNMTGMPFFDGAKYGGSFGLQGTKDFMRYKGLSLYALLGAHVFVSRHKYVIPFRGDRFKRRYNSLVAGPGLGIELRNGRIALNLEVALAGVFALSPSTYLRYLGHVNVGVFPNAAFCIYLGPKPD